MENIDDGVKSPAGYGLVYDALTDDWVMPEEKEELDRKRAAAAAGVDHPSHYQGKRECIEEMRLMFGDEAVKWFCRLSIFKYRWRAGKKDGESEEKDCGKAEWYMDYLEHMMEEKGADWG